MAQSQYREADIYNEQYMGKIMDRVYMSIGIVPKRNSDKCTQVRGLDVSLQLYTGETLLCDEKSDMTRQLSVNNFSLEDSADQAVTFALELSFIDRAGNRRAGWFHPSSRKDAINNYYVFIWSNHQKDENSRAGKLIKVSQIEMCIISYDNLRSLVSRECSCDCYNRIIQKVLNQVKESPDELVRVRGYQEGTRFVYSGYLYEKPINCVVSKRLLRKNAFIDFAFNLQGSGGDEYPVEIKRLHFNEEFPAPADDIKFSRLQ